MYIWMLVGIGGFIGAVFRFVLSGWIQGNMATFPLGTLSVNVVGSLVAGFVMYISEYSDILSEETRILLTFGFLGAFTTMSTFSSESFRLFEQGEIVLFGMNLIGTIFLVLLAVYFGMLCACALKAVV